MVPQVRDQEGLLALHHPLHLHGDQELVGSPGGEGLVEGTGPTGMRGVYRGGSRIIQKSGAGIG